MSPTPRKPRSTRHGGSGPTELCAAAWWGGRESGCAQEDWLLASLPRVAVTVRDVPLRMTVKVTWSPGR